MNARSGQKICWRMNERAGLIAESHIYCAIVAPTVGSYLKEK